MNKFTRHRNLATALAISLVLPPLVFLASPVCVYADSNVAEALQPGSWSVQFGITDNFRLSPLDGLLISCKRHYTDASALRLGLTLRGSAGSHLDEEPINEPRRQYRDGSDFTIDVTGIYMYYPKPMNELGLMLGFGPNIAYSYYEREFVDGPYPFQAFRKGKLVQRSTTVGLKGMLGFEWFLMKDVGMFASYGAIFYFKYMSNDTTNETVLFETSHDRRVELKPTNVLFGLSVYF